MLKLDEILNIRNMYYRQMMTIKEICFSTRRDYKTVRKYLEMMDFNEPPVTGERHSKLDPWKAAIDQWLFSDCNMPPKQRHTALRVYDRLTEECDDFDCSYETVARYVRKKKKEMRLHKKGPMIPLDHSEPGIAQADFGKVRFMENGIQCEGDEFVLSFPHSTAMFSVLTYGENTECLIDSLDTIFRFIGGVPPEIWFDNASSMVYPVIKGQDRKLKEHFERFVLHYGFNPVYMNVCSGNEKGSVENAVGTLRRNLYVPMPEFEDLDEYNQQTLDQCVERMKKKDHYIHKVNIEKLFEEDKKALRPLPRTEFDLSTHTTFTTNETGIFTINSKYSYSSSPDFPRAVVNVKLTSSSVIVLQKDDKTEFIRHRRLYGSDQMISIKWGPYLRAMSMKPRSFFNSGMRQYLPDDMVIYLSQLSDEARGEILAIMADLNEKEGFEAVTDLCRKAAVMDKLDPPSFRRLANQMYGDFNEKDKDISDYGSDLNELDKVLAALVRKKENE